MVGVDTREGSPVEDDAVAGCGSEAIRDNRGPCTTSQSIAVVIDLDSRRSDDVPSDAVASLTATVYSPGTAGASSSLPPELPG